MSRFLIGLYQLITGIFGAIFVVLSYFSKSPAYSNSEFITNQVISGFVLFVLLAWNGYGLIKNQSKAKTFAVLLQAIQIPLIYTASYIYKFTSAGFFSLGIKNHELAFLYRLQPIDFTISANLTGDKAYMIYLVPILFLILLSKSK